MATISPDYPDIRIFNVAHGRTKGTTNTKKCTTKNPFMGYIMLALLLVRILISILPMIWQWTKTVFSRSSQTGNSSIFQDGYVETKRLYVQEFKQIPCITYINDIDNSSAFEFLI